MAAARSENLYTAPAVTPEQSICRVWRLSSCVPSGLTQSPEQVPVCSLSGFFLPTALHRAEATYILLSECCELI